MFTSTIALHGSEARLATCHLSHAQNSAMNKPAGSSTGGAALAVVIVVVVLLAAMARAARGLVKATSELLATAASVMSLLFTIGAVLVLAALLALRH